MPDDQTNPMRINNHLYETRTLCCKAVMKNHNHSFPVSCHFLSGAKLKLLVPLLLILTSVSFTSAQTYSVQYKSGNDSLSAEQKNFVQTRFISRIEAIQYIAELPSVLHSKGFITASVDRVDYDSLSARVNLYFGEQYKWAQVSTDP